MKPIHVVMPDLVLAVIGEQLLSLRGCKTLAILSGLSRHYRQILAPVLFSSIVLKINQDQIEKSGEEFVDLPYLPSAKEFIYPPHGTIKLNNGDIWGPPLLLKILPQMHNLRRFQWGAWGALSGISLPFDILDIVKVGCPKLRHLTLALGFLDYGFDQHGDRMGRYGGIQIPLFDIRGFRNLRTLDVLNIYGNLKVQARNLGIVLAENPQLQELSLSIQEFGITQGGDEDWPNDDPRKCHNMFCTWMCDKFSDDLRQAPLSLCRLFLDGPVSIYTGDLVRLTHGHCLKQLFHGGGEIQNGIDPKFVKHPDFTAFSYATCPELCEVSLPMRGVCNSTLDAMLDSWPKIMIEGEQATQWDRVSVTSSLGFRALYHRRGQMAPQMLDDRLLDYGREMIQWRELGFTYSRPV